jgi:hypothetical protein
MSNEQFNLNLENQIQIPIFFEIANGMEKATLHKRSFTGLYETLRDVGKVYDAVERAWKDQGFYAIRGRGFYTDEKKGWAKVKWRATTLRNKGIPLSSATALPGSYVDPPKDLDGEELIAYVTSLQQKLV